MNRIYFIIILILTTSTLSAQRGVKIGYIDTEYILENLPEYNQVLEKLEEKAAEWKKEVDTKLREIKKKKASLDSERILLTNEMIKEIEEEITIDEEELSEYQQKRFGPRGDLIIQRQQLIQPVQDQIFNAIKEIAKSRNYDFIFDKSADIVMLYSDKRYDISDQILRTISRANNRRKLDSSRDKREVEKESLIDDTIEVAEVTSDEKKDISDNSEETETTKTSKKLTVKELLELRKQKNSNKRKVKD
tara:strand:- start:177 stop:920 length:744 start_codon:yes stop_codon:yes gene_type:complete